MSFSLSNQEFAGDAMIAADELAERLARHASGPTHDLTHSMLDEELLGEDQMPTDIHDRKLKRHPRVEGRGGTP